MDEPTVFAGRIHRLIKLGLSIDEEESGDAGDEDLPALEATEDTADTSMEEVD